MILLRLFPEVFRERLLAALGFLHEHHMARAERLINAFLQGLESLRSVQSMLAAVARVESNSCAGTGGDGTDCAEAGVQPISNTIHAKNLIGHPPRAAGSRP